MIERERHDDVQVLRLAHGKASALDTKLLLELTRAIAEFEESDARACVLTGTGGIFSAGVDLKRLLDGGPAYIDEFLPALDEAFNALFFCTRPVIGACNGHAIAGGCLLLSSCDLRIGARGRGRIGVPELAVGVPFPLLALEIMRFVAPPQHLQEILYGAEVYGMEAALGRGLLDEIVDAEQLEDRSLAAARRLAAYPSTSFAFTKQMMRRVVHERLADHARTDAARARTLWASEEVGAAIRDYVARTLR